MDEKTKKYNPLRLSVAFIASLMLPVAILAYTERNPFAATLAGILLPLGFYTLFAALSRRSGRMVWWGFIFIFFSAFQIVLSYLFGNSVIATDMFLNLMTTNPGEATELLSNIYPSVIAVCAVYLPLLWVAAVHIHKKAELPSSARKAMFACGGATFAAGCLVLAIGCRGEARHVLRDEVFPVNVSYNLGLAISETRKINRFDSTSAEFSYGARRDTLPDCREIYVLIIGEAARAADWQLYGYDRRTNPELSKRDDITVFHKIGRAHV